VLVQFIAYVPTNSGLQFVCKEGLKRLEESGLEIASRLEIRGEDIPNAIAESRDNPTKIVGITGEDLMMSHALGAAFQNWYLLERLNLSWSGSYEKSIYGLPTLYVIGRNGSRPSDCKKEKGIVTTLPESWDIPNMDGKIVAVPARYRNLIEGIFREVFNLGTYKKGPKEIKYLDRSVDRTMAGDKSLDYAVDIVVTGRRCEELGLGLYGALFRSDGVIIGNNAAKQFWKPKERDLTFDLWSLWFNTGRTPIQARARDYYGGIH